MYSRLDAITTGAFGQLMYDNGHWTLDTALLGLLGGLARGTTTGWGEQATTVDSCVRSFLVAAWAAREAAVAAWGPTAILEVALDAEPEPAPLSVRVRVPVQLAQWPALRGVLGTRSVLIVIRGGAQVVWCSAAFVCVGTTGPVGVAVRRRLQWTGCVTLVTLVVGG